MTDDPVDCTVVVADERAAPEAADHPVDVERWERLALAVLRAEQSAGELTLTFVDIDDIAELNEQYMGVGAPTDVLSFPLDDEPLPGVPTLLGDVVLCPAVAASQCADHAGTYADELALLIVHGILHIGGHDHADAVEAAAMRSRELELLVAHHWGGPQPPGFRQEHTDG